MKIAFYVNTATQIPHILPVLKEAVARKHECFVFVDRIFGDNKIAKIAENIQHYSIHSLSLYKTLLDKIKPDFTIYADSGVELKTKQAGHKTAQIFHGISQKSHTQLRLGYTQIKDECSDLIFFAGKTVKKKFLRYRPEMADKVHAVGYTKFDDIPAKENSIGQTILYAPTWDPEHSSITHIGNRICELTNCDPMYYTVLVKLHGLLMSSEWPDYYRNNEHTQFVEDNNILKSIVQCDLMISDYSSCMFEALALGKPVIAFTNPNLKPVPNDVGWDWRELFYETHSFYEIKELIQWDWPLKLKPQTKVLMAKLFGPMGGASRRILDIIENYEND